MAGKKTVAAVTASALTPQQQRVKELMAMKDLLNKEAGDRFLMTLQDDAAHCIEVIPTGIPSLDIALGIGGIPRGRFIEFYGPEQSGKTTAALQVAANAQRMGLSILYVDAENALDPAYCQKLGLDIAREDFVICQPDFGEQALNACLRLIDAGLIDLVIIDSVAALTPKAKFDSVAEDVASGGKFVGTHARMMSAFLGAAVSKAKKMNCPVLCLNQVRKEITPMGAKEGRPGGNALAHAMSIRVNFRRVGTETGGNKTDETAMGLFGQTKAQVVKNKFAPPMQQALFDLVFGEGADYYKNLILTGVRLNVGVVKKSSWYELVDSTGQIIPGTKRQGDKQMTKLLRDNKQMTQVLVDMISEKVSINIYDPTRPKRTIGVRDESGNVTIDEDADFDRYGEDGPEEGYDLPEPIIPIIDADPIAAELAAVLEDPEGSETGVALNI
jgi:recombination protein RecA